MTLEEAIKKFSALSRYIISRNRFLSQAEINELAEDIPSIIWKAYKSGFDNELHLQRKVAKTTDWFVGHYTRDRIKKKKADDSIRSHYILNDKYSYKEDYAEYIDSQDRNKYLNRLLDKLLPNQRDIVKSVFGIGTRCKEEKEIAAERGVSRQAISYTFIKSIEKLKKIASGDLENKPKQAFRLINEGRTFDEVGKIMGISERTVRIYYGKHTCVNS